MCAVWCGVQIITLHSCNRDGQPRTERTHGDVTNNFGREIKIKLDLSPPLSLNLELEKDEGEDEDDDGQC